MLYIRTQCLQRSKLSTSVIQKKTLSDVQGKSRGLF
jgi:hypothetical protein